MHLLIGWFAGRAIGNAVSSRPFLLAILWLALPWFVGTLVRSNISEGAAPAAVMATGLGMFVYAMWRPSISSVRLALLEGLLIWCTLAVMASIGMLLFELVLNSFVVSLDTLRAMVPGAAAMGIVGLIKVWISRSVQRELSAGNEAAVANAIGA